MTVRNVSQIASPTSSIRPLHCAIEYCCDTPMYVVQSEYDTYYLCRNHAYQYHQIAKEMQFRSYEAKK